MPRKDQGGDESNTLALLKPNLSMMRLSYVLNDCKSKAGATPIAVLVKNLRRTAKDSAAANPAEARP